MKGICSINENSHKPKMRSTQVFQFNYVTTQHAVMETGEAFAE